MTHYLYYLGALAIFPIWTVCSFVSDNISELIQWPPLLVMMAAVIAIGVIAFLVLSPLFPRERRAGLAAAISTALSVLFMMNLFREGLRATGLYSHPVLFAVSVIAIVAAAILAFVIIRNVQRLKGFVLVGGIMAAIAIWPIANNVIASGESTRSGSVPAAGDKVTRGKTRPNVYFIIVDAYARADALRKYVGMDNSVFVRELEGVGFRTLA